MKRLTYCILKERVLSLCVIILTYRLLTFLVFLGMSMYTMTYPPIVMSATSLFVIALSIVETFLSIHKKNDIALWILSLDLALNSLWVILTCPGVNGADLIVLSVITLLALFLAIRHVAKFLPFFVVLFALLMIAVYYHLASYYNVALPYLSRGGRVDLYTEVIRIIYTCLMGVLLLYASVSLKFILVRTQKKEELKNDCISYQACHDPLTGLMNRRRIYEVLDYLQKRKEEEGLDFAICIFDIDNFKRFNERYGHACGDYTLRTFSRRIVESLSQDTKVGRWGGEEFIIIFMYYDKNIPFELDALRSTVSDWPLYYDGQEIFVTATFGISSTRELSNYDAVITDADNNLVDGKIHGKNRIKISALF